MQRLFAVPGRDDWMVTQTTDRGSVFDVGALFEIPGHDVNRAVFRHVLYSRMGTPELWQQVQSAIEAENPNSSLLEGPLEEWAMSGALTHHEGMLDAVSGEVISQGLPTNPSAYNIVRRFQILKPERCDVLGQSLFDYTPYSGQDGFVVPLEYIVRFGITSASSVYKKYLAMDAQARQNFEQELGATKPLEAWQYLENPISDFTTKFEPEDRMVSKQEGLVISCLTGQQFADSAKMAVLGAWAVRLLIGSMGLRMWDIKWEFAVENQQLYFVDTIDTDSFRGTLELEFDGRRFVNHYNKQAMRDYYTVLHSDWIDAIKDAKSRAVGAGVPFTEILADGQRSESYAQTPEVAPEFLQIQEQKMSTIRDCILGKVEPSDAETALRETGQQEIAFYQQQGQLDAFAKLNGI
ncbi:MAG: phosphoribosylaminoimidazolesuccinocarboxamide synthase [Verrucomicrobiota bacterium]